MKEQVVEEVLRRVRSELAQKPAALLLGEMPPEETGYRYVTEPPYEAVILGSVDASQLLAFPEGAVLQALLEGKPVYIRAEGEHWRQYQRTAPPELFSRLLEARRRMLRMGVKLLGSPQERLITAAELRRRQREGLPISGRLTPLARDILEGKSI